MTEVPLKHIVFVPGIARTHVRPAIRTSLRMVEKFGNLFISLFIRDLELQEATKYLNAQTSTCSSRIKIVTAPSQGESIPVVSLARMRNVFVRLEKSFETWIVEELQRTSEVRINGRLVNKPSWIIEDEHTGGVSLACKHVHNLPIMSWWPTTAASLIRRYGGQESGHGARILDKISQRQDLSLAQVVKIYLQEVSDRLVHIPGIPIHHEWELFPQCIPLAFALTSPMHARGANMFKNVDMVVCCTSFEMEPISASALSNAFDKPITPFFIGPCVDLRALPDHPDFDPSVIQFLDRAYAEKGVHSVVYVAFGTSAFPPPSSISHIITVLNEITNSGLRFILTLPSRNGQLDKSWMDAQIQAGNAIFPKWTNQTAVLEHPAIHYFLTHGGWNSSTEALVRGVPMIFWPFAHDQPINTMQIATVHYCGFELLQVRTGPAKSTAYQNGQEVKIVGTDEAVGREMRQILEISRGPRGDHQRANARLLGKVIADSLVEGGSGDTNLEKLGKALGL